MSDTLFGGEVSGTPLETRTHTRRLADELVSGQGGRLAASARGAIGFSPENLGLELVASDLLIDPRNRLAGLFAALEPFERRQTEEAVSGVRSGFGRFGARFSRNAADAEARTRGELGARFARTRQEALLQADAQRSQSLGLLLQALLGARGQTLNFFQPGAPNFREGILGDIIAAGGRAAAATGGAPA